MKNTFASKLLQLIMTIILVCFVVSCGVAPQVGPVTAQEYWMLKNATVIGGIDSAIQNSSVILNNGTRYMFIYPVQRGFGFAGIDTATERFLVPHDLMKIVNGAKSLTIYQTKNFMNYLELEGWTVIDTAEVPLYIRTIIEIAKVGMESTPTILIMPVGALQEMVGDGFESLIPEELKPIEMNT